MLRVLKSNGVLYLALPDKRFTFDQDRPVTPYEHLKRDYFESPGWSEESHTPSGFGAWEKSRTL